jgi:hypothetical protein
LAEELISALSDAAELAIDRNAHEVIAGWRATARIKAETRAEETASRSRRQPASGRSGSAPAMPPPGGKSRAGTPWPTRRLYRHPQSLNVGQTQPHSIQQ